MFVGSADFGFGNWCVDGFVREFDFEVVVFIDIFGLITLLVGYGFVFVLRFVFVWGLVGYFGGLGF